MFYQKILENYNIEQLEFCYNLNEPYNNSNTIMANIPKLMPLIPTTDPTKSKPNKVSVSDSIFINDDKCKITTPKLIYTINYLTLNGYHNVDLTHHDNGKDQIPRMTKLMCEVIAGNINNINLTDKL